MAENDDAIKITPPGWVKGVFVGIGKWGPAWVMVFIVLWGGWIFMNRVMTRMEAREDRLLNTLDALGDVRDMLNGHVQTSERTQLFISTMCAGLAKQSDTAAQRREQEKACYNEYYAKELKEKTLSR